MTIADQIAVYPWRQEHLSPAIDAVMAALAARGLSPQGGPMSTTVTGELDVGLAALGEAFTHAATAGHAGSAAGWQRPAA